MKAVAISDLHVDINGFDEVLGALAKAVKDYRGDLVFIPGDISEYYVTTLNFIEALRQKTGIPIYWVPGNHDRWNKHCPDKSLDQILWALKEDDGYLGGTIELNDRWVLIGVTGWYDYSFAGKHFPTVALAEKCYGGRTWQDKIYVPDIWNDIEESDVLLEIIDDALDLVEDKNVIMMTHMVSNKNFLVPVSEDRKEWDYFNGFLGSEALCDLTLDKNVRYALCGHVHYRKTIRENNVNYLCRCLGTRDEFHFYGNEDLTYNIYDAIQVIDL